MAGASGTLAGSRLRRLAQASSSACSTTGEQAGAGAGSGAEGLLAGETEEHCELCNAPIPSVHRHMLELSSRELMCSCRPCSLLFDREGASNGRYKLVPERRLLLEDFAISDPIWEGLHVPVEMAFFFHSSAAGRVLAYYPGPMGPTESQLELSSWQELVLANPILAELDEDVEALLVNRIGGARRHWLVPLDECYSLVGLIRTHWKGLSGGNEVWQEIDRFFAGLDSCAKRVTRAPRG